MVQQNQIQHKMVQYFHIDASVSKSDIVKRAMEVFHIDRDGNIHHGGYHIQLTDAVVIMRELIQDTEANSFSDLYLHIVLQNKCQEVAIANFLNRD